MQHLRGAGTLCTSSPLRSNHDEVSRLQKSPGPQVIFHSGPRRCPMNTQGLGCGCSTGNGCRPSSSIIRERFFGRWRWEIRAMCRAFDGASASDLVHASPCKKEPWLAALLLESMFTNQNAECPNAFFQKDFGPLLLATGFYRSSIRRGHIKISWAFP